MPRKRMCACAGTEINESDGWMLGCACNEEVVGDGRQSVRVYHGAEVEGS